MYGPCLPVGATPSRQSRGLRNSGGGCRVGAERRWCWRWARKTTRRRHGSALMWRTEWSAILRQTIES